MWRLLVAPEGCYLDQGWKAVKHGVENICLSFLQSFYCFVTASKVSQPCALITHINLVKRSPKLFPSLLLSSEGAARLRCQAYYSTSSVSVAPVRVGNIIPRCGRWNCYYFHDPSIACLSFEVPSQYQKRTKTVLKHISKPILQYSSVLCS